MTKPLTAHIRIAEHWAEHYRLAFSLLYVGAWTLLTIQFVPPIYFTNDDLAFNLMAAGVGTTNTPDAHLMFTSLVIGRLLVWLYTIQPSVPWYPLYLTLSAWLASCALLYVLLLRMAAIRAIGLYSLYLGLFGVMLFSRMQFTIVALHCGLAGLALLHHAWTRADPQTRQRAMLAAAGLAMLALAAAIRIHIVLWLAILSLPLLVAAYREVASGQRIRLMLAGLTCVLVWAGIHYGNYAAYHHDLEWREFHEINSLRSSFNDYHQIVYSERSKPVFTAVGWDRLDFDMINEWFYADKKKYSTENLRRIVASFPQWKTDVGWSSVWQSVLVPARAPVVMAAFGFIVWTLATGTMPRRCRIVVLGMLASVLIAIPVLHVLAKAPPAYLLLPTMAFIAYWTLYWGENPQTQLSSRPLRRPLVRLAGGAAIAVAGIIIYGAAITESRALAASSAYVSRAFHQAPGGIKHIFVVWGNSLPPNFVPAYQWENVLRGVDMVWIGGALHSPVTKRQLARLKIGDLYRATYERQEVVLVNSKTSRERLLTEYAISRHGARIAIHEVGKFGKLRLLKAARIADPHEAGTPG